MKPAKEIPDNRVAIANATTLVANLKHAAQNKETLTIGGGIFTPAELKSALQALTILKA